MSSHAVGQSVAAGDFVAHLDGQGTQLSVVGALGHDVQCLYKGNRRPDHGRQLTGKNGDVGRGDTLAAGAEQGSRLAPDPRGPDSLAPQPRLGQFGACLGDFSLNGFSLAVGSLPDEFDKCIHCRLPDLHQVTRLISSRLVRPAAAFSSAACRRFPSPSLLAWAAIWSALPSRITISAMAGLMGRNS